MWMEASHPDYQSFAGESGSETFLFNFLLVLLSDVVLHLSLLSLLSSFLTLLCDGLTHLHHLHHLHLHLHQAAVSQTWVHAVAFHSCSSSSPTSCASFSSSCSVFFFSGVCLNTKSRPRVQLVQSVKTLFF